MTSVRPLLLALALAAPPSAARAQARDTTPTSTGLPRAVAREVVSLFNATTTLRATEALTIEAGREVAGDVAVLNGPLTIEGRVTGRVVVINADVLLGRGARVGGDLLVVGGEVEGSEGATIGGQLRVYREPLRYTQQGDQLVATLDAEAPEQWWRRFDRSGRGNSNRLEVATDGAYNRVEGLPIRVGPVLYRDQGWGHLGLDATAILRTESSFAGATPDVGHRLRGEARVGRQFGVTLGGQLYDVVEAVEPWQLSDAEAGLAALFFRRDYRDYFERHGGQLFAALRATDDADLTLSYADERWSARTANDPPALFSSRRTWRANPVLDAGRFHVVNARLRVDTRNDVFNPWAGWYLLADYERGTGWIDAPGPTSPGVRDAGAGRTRYQRASFDLRRYNRLAPTAALNLRLVLGGWLGGDPLPLQRRLSIDGPGTVPGFDFRSPGATDVSTCAAGEPPAGRPAQCERIALAQLEYRTDVRFSVTDVRRGARRNRFRADGAWVFFADAGRGWLVNSRGSALNVGRRDFPPLSSYRTDIGVGLDFDILGVYAAKAVSAPREPANVFLRIRHRF